MTSTVESKSFLWDFACMMCNREVKPESGDLKLTEAQASRIRPQRCTACGGRMLLTRADVGSLGSAIDSRVPRQPVQPEVAAA